MVTVLITVVVIAVFVFHGALSRAKPTLLGAVVPAAFVVAATVLWRRGALDSLVDAVMFVVCLAVLLGIWTDGRAKRAKRLESRASAAVAQG